MTVTQLSPDYVLSFGRVTVDMSMTLGIILGIVLVNELAGWIYLAVVLYQSGWFSLVWDSIRRRDIRHDLSLRLISDYLPVVRRHYTSNDGEFRVIRHKNIIVMPYCEAKGHIPRSTGCKVKRHGDHLILMHNIKINWTTFGELFTIAKPFNLNGMIFKPLTVQLIKSTQTLYMC